MAKLEAEVKTLRNYLGFPESRAWTKREPGKHKGLLEELKALARSKQETGDPLSGSEDPKEEESGKEPS
ncbi:MAG TPA: hypothetical protein VG457_13305 [Planctomycetota bacterium]|nr:hypothetical protein [Planctomycetota bacterium]